MTHEETHEETHRAGCPATDGFGCRCDNGKGRAMKVKDVTGRECSMADAISGGLMRSLSEGGLERMAERIERLADLVALLAVNVLSEAEQAELIGYPYTVVEE